MARLMQGNAAIAEAALRSGVSFFAGYPITPSSEIAEIMARRLPEHGGIYLQMEDELASMAAIAGASLAGARAITATSGPGFSLMQENLGFAVMAEIPCVVVNVQRSGPSTGLATRPAQADVMQARWGRHGDAALIALCPSSVQDCFDLTVRAFVLSERFRCPVVLLPDEAVGHLSETVELPPGPGLAPRRLAECPPGEYLPFRAGADGVPALAHFGSEHVFHVTSSMHDEAGFSHNAPATARAKVLRLHGKLEDNAGEITQTRYYGPECPECLVVAYGITARAARAAARAAGGQVAVLELVTMWPFPAARVTEAACGAGAVVVAEMNLGQVVREVERVVRDRPVTGCHRWDGEPLTPADILDAIGRAGGEGR